MVVHPLRDHHFGVLERLLDRRVVRRVAGRRARPARHRPQRDVVRKRGGVYGSELLRPDDCSMVRGAGDHLHRDPGGEKDAKRRCGFVRGASGVGAQPEFGGKFGAAAALGPAGIGERSDSWKNAFLEERLLPRKTEYLK